MVDGVLLLVDASRGAAAADAVRAAQGARGPAPRDPRRQQGRRPAARDRRSGGRGLPAVPGPRRRGAPDRVPDRLHATHGPAGPRSRGGAEGERPESRCSSCSCHIPAPTLRGGPSAPAHVTNLDASPYVGRLALCRVQQGTIRAGQPIAWCEPTARVQSGHGQRAVRHRGAGPRGGARRRGRVRWIAVAGLPDITIGETLADPDDPPAVARDHRRRAIAVDRRGDQHVTAFGPDGSKLTARQVRRAARPGADRQRVDPGARHRPARRMGGPGPRRASARGAGRADAARGLRADGGPAARRDARDRRQGQRADRAARRSTFPTTTSGS